MDMIVAAKVCSEAYARKILFTTTLAKKNAAFRRVETNKEWERR